jgi:hypothetical protein
VTNNDNIIPIFEAKAWPKEWSKEQEAEWRLTLEKIKYDK